MKLLVSGDRKWTDEASIEAVLTGLRESGYDELIHGGATGADSIAGRVGRRLGYAVQAFPADWDRHGRAAGPIRNQQMIDANPDARLLVYFHKNLDLSKGTKDMVRRARACAITVVNAVRSTD